jgi:hypothetical protein
MPIQHVLDQRAELVLFGGECLNHFALSGDDRPAACKIAGQFAIAGDIRQFAHGEYDNIYTFEAQERLYANLPEFLRLLLYPSRRAQVPV